MGSSRLSEEERFRRVMGHPAGLFVLFFVELWERFSFYGMRALLILYMTKELMFGDSLSYGIYGAYGALVYATPIIGGMLADRVLGYKKAITLGAVLMAFGHFAMTFDHSTLQALLGSMAQETGTHNLLAVTVGGSTFHLQTTIFFYASLALLIIGNGFFKPNISSLVGKLYDDDEVDEGKRDAGFTIFYMGINIGAFLAPILPGAIGETYGWHYGFGMAGVGMVLGLIIFLYFQYMLGDHGRPPDRERYEKFAPLIYVGSFLSVPAIATLVYAHGSLSLVLAAAGIFVYGGLLYYAFTKDKTARDRLLVVLVLVLFSMTFWAFFEQAGSSINLFTDRNVNRTVLGWTIPTSAFQSVNPAFIIALAPLFSMVWEGLNDAEMEPSTPIKFALGLLQLAAGFGVLFLGIQFAGPNGMVALGFLLGGYLLHTTGELCLSPVGLSMVTKLSPKETVGLVMGAWFLSSSFAHYIAGLFAKLASAPKGGDMAKMAASERLPIYAELFGTISVIAAAVGVVCLLLSPKLKEWMHGVR
jgi:POT family proton-dependent oligopeptide transporter